MKGTWYKMMVALIKKIFLGLLTGIVSRSNNTKCVKKPKIYDTIYCY